MKGDLHNSKARAQASLWEFVHPGTWVRLQAMTPFGDLLGQPFWTRVSVCHAYDARTIVESKDFGSDVHIKRWTGNYDLQLMVREPRSGFGPVTLEMLEKQAIPASERRVVYLSRDAS